MNLELTKEQQEKLKKLREEADCHRPGGCDLDNLSPIRKIGLEDLYECLDKDGVKCPQSLSYGSTFFCKCPARIYIFHKLGK